MATQLISLLLLMSGNVEENPGPKGNEPYRFTIKNIMRQLDVVVEWKPLGIELDIDITKLGEIECNCRGMVLDCKLAMVELWLKSDSSASWKVLGDALEGVGQKVRAKEVKELGEKEDAIRKAGKERLANELEQQEGELFGGGGESCRNAEVPVPQKPKPCQPVFSDPSKILRENYPLLVEGIQDTDTLAGLLFAKGFIAVNIKDKVEASHNPKEKNRALISAVQQRVGVDPGSFQIFIDALKEDNTNEPILKVLLKGAV